MSKRIIIIENYNANWPKLYVAEQVLLAGIIGDNVVAIHHIGSTSVIGLPAKPVIDILLEVHDLLLLETSYSALANIGYVAKGEHDIANRRYFQKGGVQRSHHLHAFEAGNMHTIAHLVFRDYLRKSPKTKQEYGQLKYRVALQCQNNSQAYMEGKDNFIKQHLALAMAERLIE